MSEVRLSLVAVALAAIACEPSIASAPPEVAATAPTAAPPAPATKAAAQARADEGSRFRVGDYVVYRYTGSFSKLPVVLHERVIEAQGRRLVIEVQAERGDERRHWIQVLTDTQENREANVVDELYEIAQGERRRLDNAGNRDLYRLFEWTLPPCKGDAQAAGKTDLQMEVAGVKFDCTCDKLMRECAGEPAQLETCECPEFVWTHASGEARALDDAATIWKVSVERFGNDR